MLLFFLLLGIGIILLGIADELMWIRRSILFPSEVRAELQRRRYWPFNQDGKIRGEVATWEKRSNEH